MINAFMGENGDRGVEMVPYLLNEFFLVFEIV